MSDYTKTVDFAVKDGLSSGNPAKIVSGTEIDTELTNIETAIASKANSANPVFSGTVNVPNSSSRDGTYDQVAVNRAHLVDYLNKWQGGGSPGTPGSIWVTHDSAPDPYVFPKVPSTDGKILACDSAAADTSGLSWVDNVPANNLFMMPLAHLNEKLTTTTVGNNQFVFPGWKIQHSLSGGGSVDATYLFSTAHSQSTFASDIAYRIDVNVADATLAAGEYVAFKQVIEGHEAIQAMFGTASAKTVTIRFMVRSNKTGTYCVSLYNQAANRTYVSEYTIDVADTWETKTITIPGDTAGTWLTGEGQGGIYVDFVLDSGTTAKGTAGSWLGTAVRCTSNQATWMDTATNYIEFDALEFYAGGVIPTAIQVPNHGAEVVRAARTFQRYADTDGVAGSGFNTATTSAKIFFPFKYPMCGIPSVAFSNVAHFGILTSVATQASTNVTASLFQPSGCQLTVTVTAGMTAGNGTLFVFNNASASITLSVTL